MRLNRFLAVVFLALGWPLAAAAAVIQGQGSTFIMTYHSVYPADHQTVMNQAAQFWADTVRSSVPIEVYVDAGNKTCSQTYNVQVKTVPPASAINFPQAPQADTYYPIALANSLAGTDLQPNAVDIGIAFNSRMITRSSCQKWYLGYDADYDYNQFSLYFETLQELAHGLGLIPLANLSTGGRLNGKGDIYLNQLKSSSTGRPLADMTGTEISALAHQSSDLAFAGTKTWAAASGLSFGRTADALLLFTRSYDAPELTGLHLHDGTRPKQLMMVDLHDAIPETDLAVTMLEDIGWATTRNNPPQITGQLNVTVLEDQVYSLSLADLILIDEAPESLDLALAPGNHYSLNQQTIVPEANYAGTLTIPVTVSDAEYTSASFDFLLSVSPVNDAPRLTGQNSLSLLEDQSLTLTLADFLYSDIDSSQFSLVLGVGNHYSLNQNTLVPDANYVGTLAVPVQISDGALLSAVLMANVTVSAVNDAPHLTGQNSLSLLEDQSLTLTLADFQYSDIDSSQFSLVLGVGSHYSLNQNTLMPEANYSGTLAVPVQISDGTNLSSVLMANVTVSAVNDAPRLTGQNSLSLLEDQSLTLTLADFQYSDIDSSQLSLVLGVGSHYSLNQQTLVPEVNYAGTLAVPVQIDDGLSLSPVFIASVTVSPVNDAPVITAIAALSMSEDTQLNLSPADLTIADPDSQSFSLTLGNGSHYQVAGRQITPDPDWFGELFVPIWVSDGEALSESVTAHINVLPVNDAPTVVAQVAIELVEENTLLLTLDMLTISDLDSQQFSLTVQAGNHYSLVGNRLTPDLDYNGALSVPVSVNDGAQSSALFNLQIEVLAENDAPILSGQNSLSLLEDQSLTLTLANFQYSDIDSSQFSLVIGVGSHYSLNQNTLVPEANYAGTLAVPVQISDGELLSAVLMANVTVNAVNDAPRLSGQNSLSLLEDQSLTLKLADFQYSDIDSSQFSLVLGVGSHYSLNQNTLVPESDYAGTLDVPVQISDGALLSAVLMARVTVSPVNDAPVISAIAALSMLEDGSLTLSSADLTIVDPDSQTFSLTLANGSHYQVSGTQITPDPDWSGELVVPVRVNDGQALSGSVNANIQVSPVNDAPAITAQVAFELFEDNALQLTVDLLTISDPDSNSFSLSAQPGNHYRLVGTRLTPDLDYNGPLSVPVSVSDGARSSALFNLQIDVLAQNDAPILSGSGQIHIDEDQPLTLSPDLVNFSDSDSASFVLLAQPGAHYELIGDQLIPEADFFGSLAVPMQISDTVALSNSLLVTIEVLPINDVPQIESVTLPAATEDQAFAISLSDLRITDPDSSDFELMINPGEHYLWANGQIVPEQDYEGDLAISIQVSDGLSTSPTYVAMVPVQAVNDAPVVTGQIAIQLEEDSELLLEPLLEQLMASPLLGFSDVDSTAFSLVVAAGDHYQLSADRLVPELDFTDQLDVPMQISDGQLLSAVFMVQIDILAVNDAPRLLSVAPQTINEDGSLFVTQALLSLIDPDNTDFALSIARGEHYQVAANEIIPDANWFGSLSIELSLSDGELSSNSLPLLLTVVAVNDLPELTGPALPTGQIYRDMDVQLTGFDLDADALTFSLRDTPDWLQLSASGLLQARPDYRAVGEHNLEIGVSDGSALVYVNQTLTILDDLSASDLSVTLAVERTLWSTDGWVPVSVTLSNLGPRSSVDATLSLAFTGDWTSQDSRCPLDSDLDEANPDRHSCVLSLTDSTTLIVSVRQATVGSSDLTLTAAHAGFEVQPDNNQARVTLTFSAGNPTTPQYSVPGFGKGQVRALGIANIQGGRWPELLFANGPGEASTSYRFEQSLFHPVLHSHLGDAADSYAMALFDADNDGDIDWVLANGGGEANSVYRNDGNGQFTLVDLLGDADSRAVAFGDVDQDGDIDLVFANLDDPNTLYLNNGDGTFSFYAELGRCRARSVLIHDFNQDGRPDILFGNHGRRNRLLFNRGFGYHARAAGRGAGAAADSLDFDTTELGAPDDLTDSMSLADFDGDGDASDIVFVNQADSERPASLQIFSVAADEQSQLLVQSQSGSVADISVADYDGDGRDDLAVLRPGGALEVMQIQVDSLLTIAVLDTDGADTILMVDVDGSGQADLISANNRSANSRLDFAGHDLDRMALNNEDASAAVLLPNPQPDSASVALPSPVGRNKGGAGVPGLVILLLWARRKKSPPGD